MTGNPVFQSAPIGLIDSGLGGLSVAREVHKLLPNESLLMIADSAWAPYGERSADEIFDRCNELTSGLVAQGCKAVVIACNTATAAAANRLRERYSLPIIGMEPAVKPAARATRNGIVGVMATTGTLASARFAALLGRFACDIRVITQPCPGLVERIECGDQAGVQTLLETLLEPLIVANADTVVLGCTHYPLIRPHIQAVLGSSVQIIDTGEAVARELRRRLETDRLLLEHALPSQPTGRYRLQSSGNVELARRLVPRWFPATVAIDSLQLPLLAVPLPTGG